MEFKIVIASLVLLGIYLVVAYNHGIKLKNYVSEAFSTMDVYLKKRWDLIPNLVEIVKGYAAHEKSVLEEVTALRSHNYTDMSEQEKVETNAKIGDILTKLIAIAENYPELKANQNFMKLNDELSQIETDISNARRYYNGTVRELNTYLEVFPTNMIGPSLGLKKAKMFEIDDNERENVKVKF